MKKVLALSLAGLPASMLWSAPAWSDTWSHHGMYGGWVGMTLGPLMMIVWIALALGAVLLVLRLFGIGARATRSEETPPTPPAETALDILKRRFAVGEIDAKTFDAMKARLAKE